MSDYKERYAPEVPFRLYNNGRKSPKEKLDDKLKESDDAAEKFIKYNIDILSTEYQITIPSKYLITSFKQELYTLMVNIVIDSRFNEEMCCKIYDDYINNNIDENIYDKIIKLIPKGQLTYDDIKSYI